MRIKSITLENWMAFRGVHVLTDIPAGAVAVVARYDGNPRRSNWAGKTALLEAIEWALFGVHRKRYEDDVIHFGQDFARVDLELDDGTQIQRSKARGKATKLSAVIDGLSYSKKNAQQQVVDTLGFDNVDYRATVCFAQGDTAAMVEKTSGERRQIVAQWLELDPWLRVAARARVAARNAAETLRDIRSELELHRSGLEDFDVVACQADIDGSKAELEAARRRLQEVETKLEVVAQIEIQRLDRQRLEAVNRERAELRDRLKVEGIEAGVLEELREAESATRHAEDAAQGEVVEAKKLTMGNFDGVCPVMCAECPVPDVVVGAKDAADARLTAAMAVLKGARAEAQEARTTLRDMEGRERSLARLRESYNARTAEARRLSEAIQNRGEIRELSDVDVQMLKDEKAEARTAEIQAATDLREAQEDLRRGREAAEHLATAEENLIAAERASRVANLAVLATGPGGIPSAIAEISLETLEQRANGILAGTGLGFVFAWDRATKSLVTSCIGCGYAYKGTKDKTCPVCDEDRPLKRADELEILVDDGATDPEDVLAKSGGAKILVGSAIRLAAGMMLRERRGARCTWAQVDEPFGALDAENRESLARSFAGMLGSVGLEQAFVVSHDGSLLDALPGRIEIVRYEDHSTLELLK